MTVLAVETERETPPICQQEGERFFQRMLLAVGSLQAEADGVTKAIAAGHEDSILTPLPLRRWKWEMMLLRGWSSRITLGFASEQLSALFYAGKVQGRKAVLQILCHSPAPLCHRGGWDEPIGREMKNDVCRSGAERCVAET